jgi:hypothetical protein
MINIKTHRYSIKMKDPEETIEVEENENYMKRLMDFNKNIKVKKVDNVTVTQINHLSFLD